MASMFSHEVINFLLFHDNHHLFISYIIQIIITETKDEIKWLKFYYNF
jgi:hypothetical protein